MTYTPQAPAVAPEEIGGEIGAGVDQGLDVIKDNMPTVFAVSIAFVAWSVGRRVLGKI